AGQYLKRKRNGKAVKRLCHFLCALMLFLSQLSFIAHA
ncbi:MAG: hypothetical protein ACI8SJ_001518, partial [Shewanella sp.]